jgi:hypothetical protein
LAVDSEVLAREGDKIVPPPAAIRFDELRAVAGGGGS